MKMDYNYFNNDNNFSDDDSDITLTELSYSRSPDSLGRSSTGSIPWAEDAVKKNQLEWERIERMFHNEEALPENDAKLREEILEWAAEFPHLRIWGQPVNFHESQSCRPSDPYHEEVYAIDPQPKDLHRTKSGAANRNYETLDSHHIVPNDLEKYLYITSGQIIRNNHASNAKELLRANSNNKLYSFIDNKQQPDKFSNQPSKSKTMTSSHSIGFLISGSQSRNNSAQSINNFNNSIMFKKLAPLTQKPFKKDTEKTLLSSSATNTRIIPTTLDTIKFLRNREADERNAKYIGGVKSATVRISPTKNIVQLPALINEGSARSVKTRVTGGFQIIGRSISAAPTQKSIIRNAPKYNVISYK